MSISYVSNMEREKDDFEKLSLLKLNNHIHDLQIIPFTNSLQCRVKFSQCHNSEDLTNTYDITKYELMEFQYEGIINVEGFVDICAKLLINYGVVKGVISNASVKFFINDDNFLYVRPEELSGITKYLQDYTKMKFYSYDRICDTLDYPDLYYHEDAKFYYVNSSTNTNDIDERIAELKDDGVFAVDGVLPDSISRQILVSYYNHTIDDFNSNIVLVKGEGPFDEKFYNNAHRIISTSNDIPYVEYSKPVDMTVSKFHCKFVYSFHKTMSNELLYYFTETGVSFQCFSNDDYVAFDDMFKSFEDFTCTSIRSSPGTNDGKVKALNIRYEYSKKGFRSFYSADERNSDGVYYICAILKGKVDVPIDNYPEDLKDAIMEYYSSTLNSTFEVIDQEDISTYDVDELADLYITSSLNPLTWYNYNKLSLPKVDPNTNKFMEYKRYHDGKSRGMVTWGPLIGIQEYKEEEQNTSEFTGLVFGKVSDESIGLNTPGHTLYTYTIGHQDGTYEYLTDILVPIGREREIENKMNVAISDLSWLGKWSRFYINKYGPIINMKISLPSVFMGDLVSVRRTRNIMGYLGLSW